MEDNKFNQTYSSEVVQAALQKIAEIRAQFPGLITLTPDERKAYTGVGERTVPFIQKAIDYSSRNIAFVPSFISLNDLEVDFQATQQLMQVSKQLNELQNQIDDTLLVAGSEAYTASLAIYKTIQQAASHSVAGAAEAANDMSSRFPGRKPAAKTSTASQN